MGTPIKLMKGFVVRIYTERILLKKETDDHMQG